VLALAGLISRERRGRVIWCKLEPDALRGASVWMQGFGQFEPVDLEPPAFYEEPWFGMLVRYGTALIAVLLVLLLAVRPLIGKLRGKGEAAAAPALGPATADAPLAMIGGGAQDNANGTVLPPLGSGAALGDLPRQVELARRLASSQPERAVEALQRMLEAPDPPRSEAPSA